MKILVYDFVTKQTTEQWPEVAQELVDIGAGRIVGPAPVPAAPPADSRAQTQNPNRAIQSAPNRAIQTAPNRAQKSGRPGRK
jgi:hypothetical protein